MSCFDDWVSTLTVTKTFKQYKISLMSEHVEKNHIINFISFVLARRNTISLTMPINISHLFVFLEKKKKGKVEGVKHMMT